MQQIREQHPNKIPVSLIHSDDDVTGVNTHLQSECDVLNKCDVITACVKADRSATWWLQFKVLASDKGQHCVRCVHQHLFKSIM